MTCNRGEHSEQTHQVALFVPVGGYHGDYPSNAKHFRKMAHFMRHRSARMTLQWVKGHDGVQGNEASDALAKQGANKDRPDPMNLEIPDDFDIQGTKLLTLMQATTYKGILERKQATLRPTTEKIL